jgi:hypothetical protein
MPSYRESATPIFDEVDRRWRKPEGDDAVDEAGTDAAGTATPSMLSFATTPAPTGRGRRAHAASAGDGSSSTVLSLIAAARRESGPRHALRR